MKRLLRPITLCVAAVWVAQPCAASPIQISYVATDLADVVIGEDLWRYDYFVSGFAFSTEQGFAVYFDHALYASLQDPPPAVNADWDPLTFQPDAALASPGAYDALALVAGASLADPFPVAFVWLGGPQTPGSQPFDLYELDAGLLTTLESGTTVPLGQPIPEPATVALLAIGAGGAAWRRAMRGRVRS